MMSFGVDLAVSAKTALGESFAEGFPHVVMVAIVAVTSYYQQKQIQGRNPNAEMPPQQKMIMRLMPAMFVFFAFVSPSALVVYFITSNLYRIGMQAYITRTLYHGEDSLGAQAQKATLEAKKLKEEEGGPDLLPRLGRRAKAAETPRGDDQRRKRAPPARRRRVQRAHRRPHHSPGSHGADDEHAEPVQEEEEAALVEWVETTGKTVEEAKDAALDQLGVDEQDAEFEVVEEPKTGLFGRTRGEARVRARVRPTQPRPKVERRDRRGKSGARSGRPSERRRDGGAKGRSAAKAPAAVQAPQGAAAREPRPRATTGTPRR